MNLKESRIPLLHGGRSETSPQPAAVQSYSMIYLVLAMLILVPVLTGHPLLTGIGKVLVFDILGSLLLAAAIMQADFGDVRKIGKALTAGPNLPITLLVSICLLSYFTAAYKNFALAEALRYGFCALAYAAVMTSAQRKLPVMLWGILFVGTAVSVIGLTTMGTGNYNEADGVTGSFGTHEQLGSFLMLCLPMAVAIGLFYKEDSRLSTAALVASLAIAACLLVARCRSAWISEVVALAVFAALSIRYYLDKKQLARQKYLIVAPILLLIVCGAYFVTSSRSGDDLRTRAASLQGLSADHSVGIRRQMWRDALKMIADKPVFGHGIGQYPLASTRYGTTGQPKEYIFTHVADLRNNAHSYYLQMIAEIGLLGFGCYAAAVISFFIAGIREMGRMQPGLRKTALLGAVAGMAGQVVDAAASPSYVFASVSLMQWVLMGIGMLAIGLPARWRDGKERRSTV
jgi:O-antigen ligase